MKSCEHEMFFLDQKWLRVSRSFIYLNSTESVVMTTTPLTGERFRADDSTSGLLPEWLLSGQTPPLASNSPKSLKQKKNHIHILTETADECSARVALRSYRPMGRCWLLYVPTTPMRPGIKNYRKKTSDCIVHLTFKSLRDLHNKFPNPLI